MFTFINLLVCIGDQVMIIMGTHMKSLHRCYMVICSERIDWVLKHYNDTHDLNHEMYLYITICLSSSPYVVCIM